MTKQEWIEQVLPLYLELQPFFERFKGEWRAGDRIYVNGEIITICEICNVVIKSSMQDGVWQLPSKAIWLPDVYSCDVERPERGLWGMVDWARIRMVESLNSNLVFSTYKVTDGRVKIFFGTPELALLKALKWQWEREKEGK